MKITTSITDSEVVLALADGSVNAIVNLLSTSGAIDLCCRRRECGSLCVSIRVPSGVDLPMLQSERGLYNLKSALLYLKAD